MKDTRKQLIYRIEDDKGMGFCRSDKPLYNKLKGLYKIPSPIEDHGINRSIQEWEKCGFLNDQQLHSCIKRNVLKMLENNGFKLKRQYVEVTGIGEHQVLYKG